MKAGLSQHTQLKQELKINPRLYQAMDLLYMPLLDLQQHLKQDLTGLIKRVSPKVGTDTWPGLWKSGTALEDKE